MKLLLKTSMMSSLIFHAIVLFGSSFTNADEMSSSQHTNPKQGDLQISSQIVSKSSIGSNDSFTVWCNSSSFKNVSLPAGLNFAWLGVTRQLDSQAQEEVVAEYDLVKNSTRSNIPDGRQWLIGNGGGAGGSNQENIWLTLTVKDASCADAGIYKCLLKLTELPNIFMSTPFRIRAQVQNATVMSPIKVTPSLNRSSEVSFNEIGDNVTMECTFKGAKSLKIHWGSSKTTKTLTHDSVKYPPTLIIGSDSCPTYSHRSTYSITLQNSDDKSTYICFVPNSMKRIKFFINNAHSVQQTNSYNNITTTTNKLQTRSYSAGNAQPVQQMTTSNDITTTTNKFQIRSHSTGSYPHARHPLINKPVVGNFDKFEMTCDLSQFDSHDLPPESIIDGIGIARQLYKEKRQLIAMLWPRKSTDQMLESYTPEGRNWSFTHSGGTGDGDKDPLRLKMTVRDARCADNGNYMCLINVASSLTPIFTDPFVLNLNVGLDPEDKLACLNQSSGHEEIQDQAKSSTDSSIKEKLKEFIEKKYLWFALAAVAVMLVVSIACCVCCRKS